MKYKKIKSALVCFTLIGALGIGSIMAYLMDQDQTGQLFSLGEDSVSIAANEENWSLTEAQSVLPLQEFTANPSATNDGTFEEYVFAEVLIPVGNGTILNDDGVTESVIKKDLFSFTANSGWTLVKTNEPTAQNSARGYIYAYGTSDACTTLAANASTTKVFDSLQFINLISSDSIDDMTVSVNYYGIQNLGLSEKTPAQIWDIIKAD